jgi:uncharacterized protein YprB with RNaseH-like and TPR domain
MIRNTFSILNGIGEKLERRLWRSGVLTWGDFIGSRGMDLVSAERKSAFDEELSAAGAHLMSGDSRYFIGALRSGEQWRLFDVFRDGAACLDIETNGLKAGSGGYATVVGIYDGREYKAFVRGENLTARNLMRELSGYKYLISFYGSVFDIPFLWRSMPGFRVNVPHFDLCFGARKLGLEGGLKKIEACLGIRRGEETRGMNGYDAVIMWKRARAGSTRALERLLSYNREDTVNLMRVAEVVYGGLRAATGIEEYLYADS